MPELAYKKDIANPIRSSRRVGRQLKLLGLTRVYYIGLALTRLRAWERQIDRAFRELEAIDVLERVPAMCALVKSLDTILDRRRILCGDPLPRGGAQKQSIRTLDLEPQSVPEPPMPEPGSGVD
jgi:hypothetical protein